MSARRGRAAAQVLDEAGGNRAMTWVMAIMLFLLMLAAAFGLAARTAAAGLSRDLAGRLTVQVVEGDPAERGAQAAAALAVLRRVPGVTGARPVDPDEVVRLLRPWLGADAGDADLPMPALIDVDVADAAPASIARVTAAVRAAAPAARVDPHEAWMAPVEGLLATLVWLALGLVAALASATAAVVMLAARAGLDAHRATIEVMHMLGATDGQVARLFQRRIARDAVLGGAAGALAAVLVVGFLGGRLAALGSALVAGATLGAGDWLLLALLPIGFVALAMAAARAAIVGALGRMP